MCNDFTTVTQTNACLSLSRRRGKNVDWVGGRAIPLNVAGAFHSRLMISAEKRLRDDLATAPIARPATKVVANITAQPVFAKDDILQSLAKQVTGTVRWIESVEYMIDQLGCNLFLELGPGDVLAGLVRRIRKGTEVLSIGDSSSLKAAIAKLNV